MEAQDDWSLTSKYSKTNQKKPDMVSKVLIAKLIIVDVGYFYTACKRSWYLYFWNDMW